VIGRFDWLGIIRKQQSKMYYKMIPTSHFGCMKDLRVSNAVLSCPF
jgi:hypothetical protein